MATGAPKATANKEQTAQAKSFARMLWRGAKKVGFGVHGELVVAWYCDAKAEVADAASAVANVGAHCDSRGYNECYNALALKYANKKRSNHDAAPLKLNVGAARAIDYRLSAQRPGEFFMPNPRDRGWQYRGCFQSVYLQTDAAARPKVSSTAAAPEYWYAGVESYSYATHAPKKVSTGYVEEGVPCA